MTLAVKEVWQVDHTTLGIRWSDDRESRFDVGKLRQQCPCATCREGPAAGASDKKEVLPRRIRSVGRYALTIDFSDGHRTGIYTFSYLRKLDRKGLT